MKSAVSLGKLSGWWPQRSALPDEPGDTPAAKSRSRGRVTPSGAGPGLKESAAARRPPYQSNKHHRCVS